MSPASPGRRHQVYAFRVRDPNSGRTVNHDYDRNSQPVLLSTLGRISMTRSISIGSSEAPPKAVSQSRTLARTHPPYPVLMNAIPGRVRSRRSAQVPSGYLIGPPLGRADDGVRFCLPIQATPAHQSHAAASSKQHPLHSPHCGTKNKTRNEKPHARQTNGGWCWVRVFHPVLTFLAFSVCFLPLEDRAAGMRVMAAVLQLFTPALTPRRVPRLCMSEVVPLAPS
ncbi:mutant required to maintain repression 1 [Anopheles sinensis]|uniref:Mutant required to maintain repression 1 n=1 Tax=Anopheles sinensis TaxID=74873 RepID=A0A084WFN4_ANOSI|nr:mutant required to maintain repression 1 [Anopheles sinensis]